MLDQLLPRSIDNTYRGHKLAFVPFGLLCILVLIRYRSMIPSCSPS